MTGKTEGHLWMMMVWNAKQRISAMYFCVCDKTWIRKVFTLGGKIQNTKHQKPKQTAMKSCTRNNLPQSKQFKVKGQLTDGEKIFEN